MYTLGSKDGGRDMCEMSWFSKRRRQFEKCFVAQKIELLKENMVSICVHCANTNSVTQCGWHSFMSGTKIKAKMNLISSSSNIEPGWCFNLLKLCFSYRYQSLICIWILNVGHFFHEQAMKIILKFVSFFSLRSISKVQKPDCCVFNENK